MQNLKNRLILYVISTVGIILSFYINYINAIAEAMPLPESGIISGVTDKLALSIKDSSVQFELPYLYVPSYLQNNAVEVIRKITIDHEFIFNSLDSNLNRHGNSNAIVIGKIDKKSLQESLLENGLALVYFVDSPQNPTDANKLFIAEGNARKTKSGIWHDDNFVVMDSISITNGYKQQLNHFIIVEGAVNNIYISKKNTYLNFGEDWKTDFTIQFDNKTLKKFSGFIPGELKGKNVRVRGWLENYNGPFMKIFSPANVEILN